MGLILRFTCLIQVLACATAKDIFASTVNLGKLIDTENYLIESLDGTLEQLVNLQEQYKRFKNKFVHHENATEEYTLKYVANPLNSFALIKRLTIDLGELNRIHNETFGNINSNFYKNPDKLYPDYEDFVGSSYALKRLPYMYKQNIAEFTDGYINGIKYGKGLTAEEVYYLGKGICENKLNKKCIKWFEESLNKWNNYEDISKVQIMEAISQAYHSLNETNASLEWDNKILNEDPDHIDTLIRKAENLKHLKHEKVARNAETQDDDKKINNTYHKLCRGEVELPEKIQSRLHCYYKYSTHPFLRIAPLKLEQIFIEPEVLLAHEMVTDSEIDTIIEYGKDNLKRSTVAFDVVNSTHERYPALTRISSTAYLDKKHEVIVKMLQRNLDLTDLVWSENIDLQLQHYPPGGFFVPHYDVPVVGPPLKKGNRIVTVLPYITDVQEGGRTVFTKLNISVTPQRGSAVYWRNLHSSGEPDARTKHAGCPLLHGIKWVVNVWVQQHDQEAVTPCGLEYFSKNYKVTAWDHI